VKLRHRWPASAPELLVAQLDPAWEDGEADLVAALDAVVTPVELLGGATPGSRPLQSDR
jgi:hypothetical protein